MAIRINDAVICGWIDNTTPGVTLGGIELLGLKRPLQLVLKGNCLRDLAGTRLDFTNPNPQLQPELNLLMQPLQRGVVGDMTVSRRVKSPLIGQQEFEDYIQQHKDIPFAWKNSIYLEWYSLANSRVIIETTDFELKITRHQWELDKQAEIIQSMENQNAINHFLEIINDTHLAQSQLKNKDASKEADEYEWEKRLRLKDSLDEAIMFLSPYSDPDPDALEESEKEEELGPLDSEAADMFNRFGPVRRAYQLQEEVIFYLADSYLDHGPRGELAMAVAYIFSVLDEAWPEGDDNLETGFKVAILKRAIDACISAISSCNTLEMEDDAFASIREDILVFRDEMISIKQHLKEQPGSQNE